MLACRQLILHRGVHPIVIPEGHSWSASRDSVLEYVKKLDFCKSGDLVVVVTGETPSKDADMSEPTHPPTTSPTHDLTHPATGPHGPRHAWLASRQCRYHHAAVSAHRACWSVSDSVRFYVCCVASSGLGTYFLRIAA